MFTLFLVLQIQILWAACTLTYMLNRCDINLLLLCQVLRPRQVCNEIKLSDLSTFMNTTASLSDVNALREDVKELMELIQKLIVEFRAVKLEVEASHLDVTDSVRLALALCKAEHCTAATND